jgi:hypothetical protein
MVRNGAEGKRNIIIAQDSSTKEEEDETPLVKKLPSRNMRVVYYGVIVKTLRVKERHEGAESAV